MIAMALRCSMLFLPTRLRHAGNDLRFMARQSQSRPAGLLTKKRDPFIPRSSFISIATLAGTVVRAEVRRPRRQEQQTIATRGQSTAKWKKSLQTSRALPSVP
eukprot:TRINITY_DN8224_c0_g1::TRINITY_DN8224_c0_g1_i1::g.10183::m.10183 TRINITY_DN8224_c0_g1::TRINITY_DN8224_c0_g1_i1::g.10183  ORF type:complete len:103 (-),score=4.36,ApoO/PF09769.4/0.09 TRINITY_DN8224_c0_g1_i1:117-425(-)